MRRIAIIRNCPKAALPQQYRTWNCLGVRYDKNPQDHPPRSDNQADGNTHRGVNRNSEHPRGQSHAPGTAASAKPKKVVDLKAVENARRQVLSDQAQAKVSAQLAGKQSDAPEPPETTLAAEPEQENPFGGKTASRHSHFLRRFLFHRH